MRISEFTGMGMFVGISSVLDDLDNVGNSEVLNGRKGIIDSTVKKITRLVGGIYLGKDVPEGDNLLIGSDSDKLLSEKVLKTKEIYLGSISVKGNNYLTTSSSILDRKRNIIEIFSQK